MILKIPLVPTVTKSVVYTLIATRKTWDPHGEYAWYVGTVKENYCCFKFYMVNKTSYIVAVNAHLLPTKCLMASTTKSVVLQQSVEYLVQGLQNTHPSIPINLNT